MRGDWPRHVIVYPYLGSVSNAKFLSQNIRFLDISHNVFFSDLKKECMSIKKQQCRICHSENGFITAP